MVKERLDEQISKHFWQTPVLRFLAVLFLLAWFSVSSRADYSDRRQIIVFSTPQSESGKMVQRSVELLRCQLVDRDTDVRFVDIGDLAGAGVSTTTTNSKQDNQAIPAELALLRSEGQPDFEMLLIGKDGGVKARTSDPQALQEFLLLVDTMPMRRAELQSRDSADAECDQEK